MLGAGTSVRFAMLLFLLLAASGSMMLTVIIGLSDGDRAGCELAAGVDPDDSGFWGPAVSTTGQIHAFQYCESLWAPAPSWWQIAAWPALLAVSAALLFRLLPLWKARRGRVVPLEAADPDGELRPLLAELAATAGLSAMPRVVVDPAAGSTGAVVFGRTRRPVVCLDGGLLVTRHRDPVRFRTVLLHELAHIANRDITLTYATVAVWRVFLVLVLLPYLLLQGYWVHEALEAGNVPSLDRKVLLAAFMVALVHLARSDTLRSREVYADLTALRWGLIRTAGPAAARRMPRGLSGAPSRRSWSSGGPIPDWACGRAPCPIPRRCSGPRPCPSSSPARRPSWPRCTCCSTSRPTTSPAQACIWPPRWSPRPWSPGWPVSRCGGRWRTPY